LPFGLIEDLSINQMVFDPQHKICCDPDFCYLPLFRIWWRNLDR